MGSRQRRNRPSGVGGFIRRGLVRRSLDLPPVAFEEPEGEQRRPTSKDRERPRVVRSAPRAAQQAPQQPQAPLTVDELCARFHSSPSIMRRELIQLGLRFPHDLTAPSQDELRAWQSAHERGDPRLKPRM